MAPTPLSSFAPSTNLLSPFFYHAPLSSTLTKLHARHPHRTRSTTTSRVHRLGTRGFPSGAIAQKVANPRTPQRLFPRTHARRFATVHRPFTLCPHHPHRCWTFARTSPSRPHHRPIFLEQNRLVFAHRPSHRGQSRLQPRCQLPRVVSSRRSTHHGQACGAQNPRRLVHHLRRFVPTSPRLAQELASVRPFLLRWLV